MVGDFKLAVTHEKTVTERFHILPLKKHSAHDSVMVTVGLNDQNRIVKAICVETAPDGTVTVPAGGFAKLTYEFEGI